MPSNNHNNNLSSLMLINTLYSFIHIYKTLVVWSRYSWMIHMQIRECFIINISKYAKIMKTQLAKKESISWRNLSAMKNL